MDVSIVIPVQNEAGNIEPLVQETAAVFECGGTYDYEIVVVDDASRDGTLASLRELQTRIPALRVIQLSAPSGQSCAVWTGVRAARGAVIATLDGDGQNDPADLPRLLPLLSRGPFHPDVHLVMGHRKNRRDSGWRTFSSRIANRVRQALLRDDTPDAGCGIKVFFRDTFLQLPHFHHMHRFLPPLFRRQGMEVRSVEVGHRPRGTGRSHYGTIDRLLAGLVDLAGMMWLIRRARVPGVIELPGTAVAPGRVSIKMHRPSRSAA